MPKLLLLFVFAVSTFVHAAEVPLYVELRDARPDGRVVSVENFELTRDAYAFTFARGTFHFLTPTSDGRTFAAVFIGEGSYELRPPSESERQHLRQVTGGETLVDSFSELIVMYGDATTDDIQKGGSAETRTPDPQAIRAWESHLAHQKKELRVNLHLRVLRDLLNSPADGVFLASVKGRAHQPALIVVDPSGIGNLAAGFSLFGGEEVGFLSFDQRDGGFWYLGNRNAAAGPARGKPLTLAADAHEYRIETKIASNAAIEGTTTIRLEPLTANIRVLPIHILPKLRLREAAYSKDGSDWTPVGIIQEEVELGRFKRLFREEVADADAAVVFPSALTKGEAIQLRLNYDGRDVLQSVGPDSWSVQARESWYPNIGTFTDAADYELTFRYPKRQNLIATGVRLREEPEGDEIVSVWKSEKPMWVAGFNYGRFEKISRTDEQSGASIDLYTTRDFRRTANDSLIDAINTARVATLFFGKSPFTPVSVTQQAEWNFGQSWPSLIYLPPLALTTSTERAFMMEEAGPQAMAQVQEFAKMVGWHEFAHQWWGHEVGWQSYRDQWLSEGFAEFTAALVLQLTESTGAYDRYWERRRREIVDRQKGGVIYADAGPISNGFRLATRMNPEAVNTIIYSKGAYVLHMLRRMLHDSAKQNADEAFIVMMRDFVKTYGGKSPSTADFQKVVEKHMTAAMNAGGDGTMKWFFDQWIYGTEVPRITSKLEVEKMPDGKYRIHGTVTQADVSDEYRSVVPLYLEMGKDEWAMLGRAGMKGSTTLPINVQLDLPKAPRRATVNAMHDVLARE